jgi:hypothetical protein
MCQCLNSCGCDSSVELPYLNGLDGLNGKYGGHSSKWTFKSEIIVAPVINTLRMNNATPASVTALYIHQTDANAVNMSLFLASFNNSNNYGLIKIFKEYDDSKFWIGRITNVTNTASYYTITVTYIHHNGTFNSDEALIVSFTPQGIPGNDGDNSTTLAWVEESLTTDPFVETKANTVTGAFSTVLTIPEDILVNDEDCYKFQIHLENAGTSDASTVQILVNATILTTVYIPTGKSYIYGEINETKHFFITTEKYAAGVFVEKEYIEGHTAGIPNFTSTNTISLNVTSNKGGLTINKIQSEIILKG